MASPAPPIHRSPVTPGWDGSPSTVEHPGREPGERRADGDRCPVEVAILDVAPRGVGADLRRPVDVEEAAAGQRLAKAAGDV